MIIIIRQRQKARGLRHGGLMHTPDRPGPSSGHPTANTLTTGQRQRSQHITPLHKGDRAPLELPSSQGAIARHLQPPAATARRHLNIEPMSLTNIVTKIRSRMPLVRATPTRHTTHNNLQKRSRDQWHPGILTQVDKSTT
jgi:hypothetical protein